MNPTSRQRRIRSSTEDPAERVISFFRQKLRHTKGEWAGQEFALLPWQEHIVRALFGTLRPDGLRQYRTALISVPRKQGKSTLAAGMGLYLTFSDRERGCEVYSAAADRDQAAIVFNTARDMVLASPDLRSRAHIFRRVIEVPKWNAIYRVLSADVKTKHGLNAHGVVFDELHAQPNRDLWDVLTTATGARLQPLVLAITTAGYDRQSICYEIYDYAKKVLSGVIDDPSFFAYIAEAGEQADWQDPETWRGANPSLGTTVSEEYLAQEAGRAREMPAYQNTFRRLHLNQWTQQATRWIDINVWNDNAGPKIDEDALRGRECYGGLDLASVSDMVAWVMVFPNPRDREEIQVLPRFWCPEARLTDTHNRYRDQYQAWRQQGYLQTTRGDAIDYAFVKQQILEDAKRFRLIEMGVDRLFQAHQLATELLQERLTVIGMGMGFLSMAAPCQEFERRLLNRKVRHGGNPVLMWNADNVAVDQDPAGNKKPDKATSQGKIDGIVALLIALDRAMRHGGAGSVYEGRGVRVL